MPKKERAAKAAAFAMAKELDSEMTDEQRERMVNSGMGIGGGLNKGEDELFAKKMTKEEKTAISHRTISLRKLQEWLLADADAAFDDAKRPRTE